MFPFDRLVKFYDFSKINKAIADAKSGDTVKPVLRISKEQVRAVKGGAN
jgi:aryl-alcohol dehydrogenase